MWILQDSTYNYYAYNCHLLSTKQYSAYSICYFTSKMLSLGDTHFNHSEFLLCRHLKLCVWLVRLSLPEDKLASRMFPTRGEKRPSLSGPFQTGSCPHPLLVSHTLSTISGGKVTLKQLFFSPYSPILWSESGYNSDCSVFKQRAENMLSSDEWVSPSTPSHARFGKVIVINTIHGRKVSAIQ